MQTQVQHPDCLIVLDTLGVRSSAAIIGITALRFDLDDPSAELAEFSTFIDPDSNRDARRSFDTATLQYWADRPDFREVFARGGIPLRDALIRLTAFYDGSEKLWVSGAGFESSVLANAFEHFDLRPPWPYWCVRDARTMYDVSCWLDGTQCAPSMPMDTTRLTAGARYQRLRETYETLRQRALPTQRRQAC